MSNATLLGWNGISSNEGKFVAAEDGFEYVCQQVGIEAFDSAAPEADEFKEMLIEWYFSGNWIEAHKVCNISAETLAALNRMGARAHGGEDDG